MNRLLHNMSTPPSSVIRYEGPKGPATATEALKEARTKGTALLLCVKIPKSLQTANIKKLSEALAISVNTKEGITEAISQRALTLPFLDVQPLGNPEAKAFLLVGLDSLAIASLATQSSGFAWFRHRIPDLLRLKTLNSLTLCVRPSSIPNFLKIFTSHETNVINFANP